MYLLIKKLSPKLRLTSHYCFSTLQLGHPSIDVPGKNSGFLSTSKTVGQIWDIGPFSFSLLNDKCQL